MSEQPRQYHAIPVNPAPDGTPLDRLRLIEGIKAYFTHGYKSQRDREAALWDLIRDVL